MYLGFSLHFEQVTGNVIFKSSRIRTINRRPRLTIPSMFNNMWDVKEPKHYSKRVGREVPGVVAVLCVVNTGPMLIAVTTITEMVILYKYVEMMNDF